MTMSSNHKQVEISFEDSNPQKWRLPLKEDSFRSFMEKEKNNATAQKVFSRGSLFSPFLFGKFFDPSDAFPLWEFEADVLLATLRSSNHHCNVDWLQSDADFTLKAELPGVGNSGVQICIENRKVLEIRGVWREQQREGGGSDWKSSSHWWEHGFVRRIELPENADWRKMEANMNNDPMFLQIRIPKAAAPNS
ncbi:unnamed protein product [Cuscuta epithymum]|uniref:SHSP domain-containing protein n=1 Tax=Cuscuta epithymum TaxID=186058 RepID=A0AAV0EDX7_9ASTE|nr:unnamed protein product [Cuscuta epithymum]